MKADATDAELVHLGMIEKESGFRTGTRFSFEGRRTYEVVVNMETREFFISEDGQPLRPLTKEMFTKTSGLCYWSR